MSINQSILKETARKVSLERNLNQAIEEAGELIVAIRHYLRHRDGSKENLAEEIGDMKIIIKIIEMALDEYTEEDWARQINKSIINKLIDLKKKIDSK